MKPIKLLAIVLLVAGILGLSYGKFSFSRETHHGSVGPMDFSVKHTETTNIPLWAGVAALVAGAVLLIAPAKSLPGN